MQHNCEHEILNSLNKQAAHDYINKYVEEYHYEIYTSRSNYNEFSTRIQDDTGSIGLSMVCTAAKKDYRKIYLSGQGADEIFSDYGFQGRSIFNHSNFGGLFPQDLKTIFPWPSFYGSSQRSYLTKEEYVAGSYGIEARYPFLDKAVVQEFLWLKPELKNNTYKSVLDNLMTSKQFPFARGSKIGFGI
jgi:asparagine synthetase B (glutamine-hydrolysing)